MIWEAMQGLAKHVDKLWETGIDILISCLSPWNTFLFLVLNPGTQDYLPGQDLRDVNKSIETPTTS